MATDTITGNFEINAEVDVESIEAAARKSQIQSVQRLLRYKLRK